MPDLNEILKERKTKKFVKKNYRPWDLSGQSNENDTIAENITSNGSNPHFDNKDNIEDEESNLEIVDNNLITLPPHEEKASPVNIVSLKTKDLIEVNEISSLQFFDDKKSLLHLDNPLGNNRETIGEQLEDNKSTNRERSGNAPETDKGTNGEQIGNTFDPTTLYNRIFNLTGIQRKILDLVAEICSSKNQLETGPLETSKIANHINTPVESVKTSIKRLINKGFISRNMGRRARGGFVNFYIQQEILDITNEQKKFFVEHSSQLNSFNVYREQLENNYSYISSNTKLNTITKSKEVIPEEWNNVDYESLHHIGFSKTQIMQLIDKADPNIVQESINHFAFGLENNQKLKKYDDPLNVLMGVLRKGQAWFEKDYRSPKEIAQLRLLEIKKAEIERKKQLEEEMYKLAFDEWQQNLNQETIEGIAPDLRKKGDPTPRNVKLSIYFKENIWPQIKKDYLIS
ncbi:hypothetical protein [Legionella feeleii]|uniref:Predicted transcriptional regulator n=1 Tax=Legionella feeleii TaxID=453 RepID=A0A378KL78_9GAMM|nr:hypothetical protein [Legionella feeleii]STX88252.1 Predicted transcriptional regulator [Legionella feeleii]